MVTTITDEVRWVSRWCTFTGLAGLVLPMSLLFQQAAAGLVPGALELLLLPAATVLAALSSCPPGSGTLFGVSTCGLVLYAISVLVNAAVYVLVGAFAGALTLPRRRTAGQGEAAAR